MLEPKPKATSGPPTHRKPKPSASAKPTAAAGTQAPLPVDPDGFQAALDVLAALLPPEMITVIQEQVKSTSYNLVGCSQGPTRRKGTKGGVSSPPEDLRPVSEVEAGVNFRSTGGARCGKLLCTLQGGDRIRFQKVSWGCGDTFRSPGCF